MLFEQAPVSSSQQVHESLFESGFQWVNQRCSDQGLSEGIRYLQQVQKLAIDPGMINVLENLRDRQVICTWIGENIPVVNARLNQCLQACQDCFYPQERRSAQIFAVPLAQSFQIDGLCNLQTRPYSILIDVGRVPSSDWMAIVAHEYAHAQVGNPGHDITYAQVLAHLCLGLGLEAIDWEHVTESRLRHWPPYTPKTDPLAFWRGME
ncbi:hypothetical protein K9N68_34720 (plasmid) [Kovacikia minuta CCNUW1]|uniref:hypothetical protein n=1 Tax=Kovacikia minuta TaxID=2931930 RepID=UPI001CCC5639|nr:hypothetical protein [Kovacikia minuta]UBF30361.1 hypothetical protein K9N68_34720 [Kovacikia minuta CCNUW1]